MTTSVAIAHYCDAEGCQAVVTVEHFSTLGAQSEARFKLRRVGWIAERPADGSAPLHFCPDHHTAHRCRKWTDSRSPRWNWSTPDA